MSKLNDEDEIIISDSLNKALSDTLKMKKYKINIDYELYEYISKKIGLSGWTVPFSITFADMDLFEKDSLTRRDIDAIFYKYYSEDEIFESMIDAILSNKNIERWHEAIEQCVYAHKNKMFILSISTLIPILEGILSTFENNKTNIKMMKVCKEMLETTDNKSIKKIMWISCYHFISTLYQKSDFSGTEPETVNRHWILHGRTAFNNSEIDSIRIFNAIETVSKIMKYNKKNKG
ncbi:hypothetical protein ACFWMS_02050 [Peribacillus butanolivorans]|uniref:hypothetical protein n=1 Tax=Peribacillus butanolivorans TaxID=421767 RepID=UPI00364A8627